MTDADDDHLTCAGVLAGGIAIFCSYYESTR